MRPVTAAAVAILGLLGCYSTATIPPAEIASLHRPLSAPKPLGDGARFGPRTEIRVHRTDGTVSAWFSASDVGIGEDGLVTGKSYALAAASEAVIMAPDAGAAALLSSMAPPGSEITPTVGQSVRVRVADPRLLLPWIAAYATGSVSLQREPGMFSFRTTRGEWATERVPGTSFAARAPMTLSRVKIAEGIPWRDVASLEVQNMDPLSTTGAIVGAPLAGAAMALAVLVTVAEIGDGDEPIIGPALGAGVASVTQAAADSGQRNRGTSENGEWVDRGPGPPAVLLAPAASGGTVGAMPLFSAAARRRDDIKAILTAEVGLDSQGSPAGGGGAGLRICDFVEITGRLRLLAFDDRSPSAVIATGGSAPLQILGGARLALHIDRDGDPLTSFVFGGEVLGGSLRNGGSLTQVGFVLGPRFGISDKMFASFLVTPSLLSASAFQDRPAQTVGQVMFSAEFGFDL